MFTSRCAIFSAALLSAMMTDASLAETPNLGKPIDETAIAAWDISILPDGAGLPKGSGTPAQGAVVYADKCALCHGDIWPYSTTIFDFIRRAMPFQTPRSLTDDEVYALTAYILAENKLIGANDMMNAQTLPKVKMPNRENFIIRFPDRI